MHLYESGMDDDEIDLMVAAETPVVLEEVESDGTSLGEELEEIGSCIQCWTI